MATSGVPQNSGNYWDKLGGGNLNGLLSSYKDLLLPVGLLLIVGTLFIPLQPWMLSLLVLVNLAFSITVLVTALFINSPVQLTSYPTLLLLSTIFRLAISVSITRSILSNGYAGEVVKALGEVTAQGNIITGAVMFIIILVVQFLVVGKGSERVAEVAARFTLDAMPGKQMAIDADLRSGLIDQKKALEMREELARESQLHGAMDGAMKFVKGDSIATIIIAVVNISAGLMIGIMGGLSPAKAAEKYTILTFGDGLAAIISSLLITLSAGIVVTRVSSRDSITNVGGDIADQLFTNPKPLFITGGVMLLLTPLNLFFVPVGLSALGAGYLLRRRAQQLEASRIADSTQGVLGSGETDEIEMSYTVPMAVVVSSHLNHLIDKDTGPGSAFRAEIPKLRSALYYDLGVMVPYCYIGGDAPLGENEYYIAVKEVPVGNGSIKSDCVYVNDSAENIEVFGLKGENVLNPADLSPGAWIPADQRSLAETAGLKVWEPSDVIILHLSRVMKKYAHDFLGIQEAQGYLDFIQQGMPKLVEEVVPNVVTIHQFTDVLQRLVQEGISIRDTKSILDALSEWGRIEKDPVMLTEHVRASMRRYISFRYTGGRDTLFVHLLDPEIEDVIRAAVRRTSTGSFLSLDPAIANDILDAIRGEIANLPPTAQEPLVVTDMDLRRFVRKMVEIEFPNLPVLSYQELTPELNVQPIGRISMRAAENSPDFAQFEHEYEELPGPPLPLENL
ncbi:MAG: type III secretion system export apparatus subunit SctV [Pyrinomonadaceae bacterium]|nr:type III secretion system export apparatus subunit SctV [Pyrinomonadaceae bacterium]